MNIYKIPDNTNSIMKSFNNYIILLNNGLYSNDITVLDNELNIIKKIILNNNITIEDIVYIDNKFYVFCNNLNNVYSNIIVYVYNNDFKFIKQISIPINITTKINYIFIEKNEIIVYLYDKIDNNFIITDLNNIIVRTVNENIYSNVVYEDVNYLIGCNIFLIDNNYCPIKKDFLSDDEVVLGSYSNKEGVFIFTKINMSTYLYKIINNNIEKHSSGIATNTEKIVVIKDEVFSLLLSNENFYIVKNQ